MMTIRRYRCSSSVGPSKKNIRSDDDYIRLCTGASSVSETGREHVGSIHENDNWYIIDDICTTVLFKSHLVCRGL